MNIQKTQIEETIEQLTELIERGWLLKHEVEALEDLAGLISRKARSSYYKEAWLGLHIPTAVKEVLKRSKDVYEREYYALEFHIDNLDIVLTRTRCLGYEIDSSRIDRITFVFRGGDVIDKKEVRDRFKEMVKRVKKI